MMIRPIHSLCRFFMRFRYPVTLPEEIAQALGVDVSNFMTFEEFVGTLSSPKCRPTNLCKFMPRRQVEEAFPTAQRKERFGENTLISYYFNEGWMVFTLKFDSQSRLKEIKLQHERIKREQGIELPLHY